MSPSAPSAPLRIAVVGCGAVAEIQHLPALQAVEGAEDTALVDLDEARARKLLGYEPRFDLDRGLELAGEWARWANLV